MNSTCGCLREGRIGHPHRQYKLDARRVRKDIMPDIKIVLQTKANIFIGSCSLHLPSSAHQLYRDCK